MKKVLMILALVAFVGSVSVTSIAAENNDKIEVLSPTDDPDKKEAKKKCDKSEKKACCKKKEACKEKKSECCKKKKEEAKKK